MKVMSNANFKGGVGKTTTVVNLAAIWAGRGQRVLLIDADPQHNASTFFRCEDERPSLSEILRGKSGPVRDLIAPAGRENLWILPGDMELLGLDLASMKGQGGEIAGRLADLLEVAGDADFFDRVLIDCPPSFTAASVAALSVSQTVLLPTDVSLWSISGVEEMIRQIHNISGALCRVLITMTRHTRLSAQGEALLRERFCCLDRTVRLCAKVPESTYSREPLLDYAPNCTAAVDYLDVARELEEMGA